MHLSVVVGKEVVKQYYGSAQNKSYYMGCSQGECRSPFRGVASETYDFRWSLRVRLYLRDINWIPY